MCRFQCHTRKRTVCKGICNLLVLSDRRAISYERRSLFTHNTTVPMRKVIACTGRMWEGSAWTGCAVTAKADLTSGSHAIHADKGNGLTTKILCAVCLTQSVLSDSNSYCICADCIENTSVTNAGKALAVGKRTIAFAQASRQPATGCPDASTSL